MFRAGADGAEAPALLPFVGLAQIHLKITAPVLLGTPPSRRSGTMDPGALARWLATRFGTDRLLWGSNHPASGELTYRGMRELAERASSTLGPVAQRKLLGDNADRLYGLSTV